VAVTVVTVSAAQRSSGRRICMVGRRRTFTLLRMIVGGILRARQLRRMLEHE
jgi:hypothetical protein